MPESLTPELARPGRRQRFSLLDGQRGLAALIVMLRHCHTTGALLPVAYTAVDFFFLLSGFVIGYTYEQKLRDRKITTGRFLWTRFVRLYPMILFGTVFGAIPVFAQLILGGYPIGIGSLLGAFFRQLFLIPSPPLIYDVDSLDSIFPFNMPEWSLFFEVLANIAFAMFVFYITPIRLFILAALAAAGLGFATLAHGSMILGVDLQTLPGGLCRIGYSFTMGLLIHRLYNSQRFQLSPILSWLLSGILVALLICPQSFLLPNEFTFEMFVVLICFPLLVFLGAHTINGPRLSAVCDFAGRLSYPLYLTHFPIIFVFNWYIERHNPHGSVLVALIILQFSAVIACAVLALLFYDEPLRRAISSKLLPERFPAKPVQAT
jgi:peptidoglycan/LPS O-acetylase OafA/YrhL